MPPFSALWVAERARKLMERGNAAPKVITSYWPKPIPTRDFDWTAWVDGTEENRWYGYGKTEAEAVADLVNNVLQQDASS